MRTDRRLISADLLIQVDNAECRNPQTAADGPLQPQDTVMHAPAACDSAALDVDCSKACAGLHSLSEADKEASGNRILDKVIRSSLQEFCPTEDQAIAVREAVEQWMQVELLHVSFAAV